MNASPIHLGRRARGPVFLEPEDRSRHFFIAGASRSGKSNAMTHMTIQDLLVGNSVISIDPHGQEYHRILRWMTSMDLGHQKMNLFHPSSGVVTGFNPLAVRDRSGSHIATVAGQLVDAVGIIFNEHATNTPQLQRILGITFCTAISLGMTLLDVPGLLSTAEISKDGSALLLKVGNSFVKGQLEELYSLRKKNIRAYQDAVSSAHNRLSIFLLNPLLQQIFSAPTSLDIRGIIDRGESLLVNLAPSNPETGIEHLSPLDIHVLGTLLVNEVFNAGQSRPEGSREVMVYLDEFPMFINRKIGRTLEQSGKRGVCMHLACQHLYQLKEQDEAIFHSVMSNAQNHLIFRMGSLEDAKYLASQNFTFDLKKVKHTEPHVVDYKVRLMRNQSTGAAETKGTSTNWSKSEGTAETTGSARTEGTAYAIGIAETRGTSVSQGSSTALGLSLSEGTTSSRGSAETEGTGTSRGRALTMGSSTSENSSFSENEGGSTSKGTSKGSNRSESLVDREKADEYREKYFDVIYLDTLLGPDEYDAFLEAEPAEKRVILERIKETYRAEYDVELDEKTLRVRPNWTEMVPRTSTGSSEGESESEGSSWGKGRTRGEGSTLSRSATDSTSDSTSRSSTTSESSGTSRGKTASKVDTKSEGVTDSESATRSETLTASESLTTSESTTRSQQTSHGGGANESATASRSEGYSEAMVPILEERPASFYSLEEEEYVYATLIRQLQRGEAVYKPLDGEADVIEIERVYPNDWVPAEMVQDQIRQIYERQTKLLSPPPPDVSAVSKGLFGIPALKRRAGESGVSDEPEHW